jgi:hypothetical protein
MRPLSAAELLGAWEQALAEPPVQQALALLAAACPETPVEDLARESVGRRDARLLRLREWTFGPRLVSLASCPRCGERLETDFDVAEIRVDGAGEGPAEPLAISISGYELTFRLPNSLDLLDLASLAAVGDGLEEARRRLLARCLLGARSADGGEASLDHLPETALQAVADRMAEADPQGEVQLALRCPACSHAWPAVFDIASYFWTEVDAWARGLLREIHVLASAYGWWEGEILALSPWRRRAYLELIGG